MVDDSRDARIRELELERDTAVLERDAAVAKQEITLTPIWIILGLTFTPMAWAFIGLATIIIWSAANDPEVAKNMEGLLVGLSIMGNIVSAGMGVLIGAVGKDVAGAIMNGRGGKG